MLVKKGYLFFVLAVCMVCSKEQSKAQKKAIDTAAIKNWEYLGQDYNISGDGRYVYYKIETKKSSKLILFDIKTRREKQFSLANDVNFWPDGSHLSFINHEGVFNVSLPDFKTNYFKQATSYKLSGDIKNPFILFTNNNELWKYDVSRNSKTSYGKIVDYYLNLSGTILLLKRSSDLEFIDIKNKKKIVLHKGGGVKNVVFDKSGYKIAFSVELNGVISLYRYAYGENEAKLLLNENEQGLNGVELSEKGLSFNYEGDFVFFRYRRKSIKSERDTTVVQPYLNVWNYKDQFLQSNQEVLFREKKNTSHPDFLYRGLISFSGTNILTPESENMLFVEIPKGQQALLKSINNDDEVYWNDDEWPDFRLFSLPDGRVSKFLPTNRDVYQIQLSSSQRFVTWIDSASRKYFSYEIKTGKIRDFSKILSQTAAFTNLSVTTPYVIEGWLKDDRWILASDKFDIWLIDPYGQTKPICVTGGVGRLEGRSYGLLLGAEDLKEKKYGDELTFVTLDLATKNNGFASGKLMSNFIPRRLSSDRCLYYFPNMFLGESQASKPRKAKKSNVYLVERQSDEASKNLFVTKDFRSFKTVSAIHPEHNYEWFYGQMINYITRNGEHQEGILYQPHNIDTSKKYPIIFNYYEKRSGERFKFIRPGLSSTNINVPWYLSRGYLVFIPNISKRTADFGEVAVQTVVSGADYLTKTFPWIDANKMGIQGHSYGGSITNFLATHTSIFAAAQSSAGRSDEISGYGGIGFGGKSLQGITEEFQNNLKTTPWDNPDVYIRNSAIFGIGKTNTPLLIMHGNLDQAVPFSQAVELFTGLRRARKKVWLLEYGGSHVMFDESEDGRDFAIRQQQFFDHYLKGAPAPLWMVEGVPYNYRGIKSGLKLDSLNRTP